MVTRPLSPIAFLLLVTSVSVAQAQPSAPVEVPACTGSDPAGASAAFEAGNALMAQAIDQASHRHLDRAQALADQLALFMVMALLLSSILRLAKFMNFTMASRLITAIAPTSPRLSRPHMAALLGPLGSSSRSEHNIP